MHNMIAKRLQSWKGKRSIKHQWIIKLFLEEAFVLLVNILDLELVIVIMKSVWKSKLC